MTTMMDSLLFRNVNRRRKYVLHVLVLVRDHREKIGARHSDAYDSNAARRIQFNAYRQPNNPFLPEHDSEVPSKPLTRVVLRLHVWIEEPEGGASSLKADGNHGSRSRF
jgi:hypothetical protein